MSRASSVLPGPIRRALVEHARREHPDECCGLLVGRSRRVLFAVAMENVSRQPRKRFRIGDRAHIELRRALRRFVPPLEVVGVYHSHPGGPAEPSPTDLAGAHYPEWLYVVIGLGTAGSQPHVEVYRLTGGRFVQSRGLRARSGGNRRRRRAAGV